MNKQTLVDGYQPSKSGDPRKDVRTVRGSHAGADRNRAASGPTPAEKLPKTTSSVSVPKK